MPYINSIGIANPENLITQDNAISFMNEMLELDVLQSRQIKALYKSSGIDKRYSVISDYNKVMGEFTFYPNTKGLEPFPTVAQRMKLYEESALSVAIEAIRDCIKEKEPEKITHLITVSCTGMIAPGLDIEIIKQLNLNKTIERTAIIFMGCYAAFNAIKAANNICKANSDAVVLIVCVELCSLHFQKKTSLDSMVASAIFGDGAAAVLVESKRGENVSLDLQSFHCDLAPEGESEMSWKISDYGFEMVLTSYVPEIIKNGIKCFMENLFSQNNMELKDIDFFAIHPGGKKILEAVEQAIGITKSDNKYSYDILKNYGNMSSATVLFVLKKIMDDLSIVSNAKILSFAFGPGLTLESMILKLIVPEEIRLQRLVEAGKIQEVLHLERLEF